MNCETCDQLLKAIGNMSKMLACLESSLSGENSQGVKFDGIDMSDELEMLNGCTDWLDEISNTVIFESIKAHMNRYLHVYSVLENKPCMSEGDKANGYAELGAEIADLETLFEMQDGETRVRALWSYDK
jgi:hypothetical protein